MLLGGLRLLRSLDIEQRLFSRQYRPSCDPLDDACFMPVWKNCTELESLTLPGIYRLTDLSFDQIATSCPNMNAISMNANLEHFEKKDT